MLAVNKTPFSSEQYHDERFLFHYKQSYNLDIHKHTHEHTCTHVHEIWKQHTNRPLKRCGCFKAAIECYLQWFWKTTEEIYQNAWLCARFKGDFIDIIRQYFQINRIFNVIFLTLNIYHLKISKIHICTYICMYL